jgi:O-methyltransferase
MSPVARLLYDIYLIIFRRTYFGGRMASCHDASFMDDPRFDEAFSTARERNTSKADTYAWNVMVACWAASQASRLDGDFIECGTDRGSTAAAVLQYLSWKDNSRRFWLFDTFQGMVESQISKTDFGAHNRFYEDTFHAVQKYFGQWSNVRPVQGVVPDSLKILPDQIKVAFLHIDMNCAEPESAALEFFRDKLVPGALILLDDYGWIAYRNQKTVHDTFAESIGRKVLPLPTGQGLIIV